ncbi:hypothetical protein QYE76_037912 [Lolium multiflorum]|uniref:F-box domain-containing protein n=1 Tax=Lolium multiflorum TaxID=4521 RepID=A0AAD8T6W2_LOLMU|nr:hypothetical protein QYE76_037912 [Lolium multiflorum]
MVYIPTELVLEILTRLPWTSLRWLRLVCRTWRHLAHQRTKEMQQCRDAVPLVVTMESGYVLDSRTGTTLRALARPHSLQHLQNHGGRRRLQRPALPVRRCQARRCHHPG